MRPRLSNILDYFSQYEPQLDISCDNWNQLIQAADDTNFGILDFMADKTNSECYVLLHIPPV